MADREDIKRKLRVAVMFESKQISEKALENAVFEIVKKAHVVRTDLREIGQKVANDRTIFEATDLDDINNLLDQLGDD